MWDSGVLLGTCVMLNVKFKTPSLLFLLCLSISLVKIVWVKGLLTLLNSAVNFLCLLFLPNQPVAQFVESYIKFAVVQRLNETIKQRRCMFCLSHRKHFLVGHLLSNHWLDFSVIDDPPLPCPCSRVILRCACRARESASTQETKEMCVERRRRKKRRLNYDNCAEEQT